MLGVTGPLTLTAIFTIAQLVAEHPRQSGYTAVAQTPHAVAPRPTFAKAPKPRLVDGHLRAVGLAKCVSVNVPFRTTQPTKQAQESGQLVPS